MTIKITEGNCFVYIFKIKDTSGKEFIKVDNKWYNENMEEVSDPNPNPVALPKSKTILGITFVEGEECQPPTIEIVGLEE